MGTLHSETLLGTAKRLTLVSREKLHSCSTRGKHESRGSLHSGKTRIPREVGEEAEVEEASPGSTAGDVERVPPKLQVVPQWTHWELFRFEEHRTGLSTPLFRLSDS